MKNFLLLLAGALFIGLLSFVCFSNKLEPITKDLITRTSEKLNKNGLYGLDVDIVGKDYKTKLFTRISGSVVSEEEKKKAISIAKSIYGVFGVEDNITVVKAQIIKKKTVFEPVEYNTTKKVVVNDLNEDKDSKKDDDIKLFKEDSILPDIEPLSKIESCQERLNKLLLQSKINFASSKTDIKKESYPLLEKIANIIKECRGDIKLITIEGYTDSSGSEKSNLLLSQDRAEAVKNYLVNKFGIDKHMLKAVGYGESKPIADNSSEEGKRKNRRIEFKLEGGSL